MSKTLVVVIKLKDDADTCVLTDSFNEVMRNPDVYRLIDDSLDSGWEYLRSTGSE